MKRYSGNQYSEYLLSCRPLLNEDGPDSERAYIENNAERYAEQIGLVGRWRREYAGSTLRALDVGCYPGHLAMLLKQYHGATVVGAGITANKLFLKRMRDVQIEFHRVDVEREPLPFRDGCFDVVLFTEIIEHLFNPFPVGREIGRLLTKGGLLVLSTPNMASLRNRIAAAQGKVTNHEFFSLDGQGGSGTAADDIYPPHVRLWLPAELRLYLENRGMRIVRESYQHYTGSGAVTRKERVLQAMVELLPVRFRDMITIAAVKT